MTWIVVDGVVRLGVGSVDDVDESARLVDVGGRGGSGAGVRRRSIHEGRRV